MPVFFRANHGLERVSTFETVVDVRLQAHQGGSVDGLLGEVQSREGVHAGVYLGTSDVRHGVQGLLQNTRLLFVVALDGIDF